MKTFTKFRWHLYCQGSRAGVVGGGMHLTHATYLPNLLLKMVTATESRHVTVGALHSHIM